MITPDPNLPDPNSARQEPIEHLLSRIEASGQLLTSDGPICSAGCEMLPMEIMTPSHELPIAVAYDHQIDCPLYGTGEA